MKSRVARVRASAQGEARSWKARHDALLDVLAAILLAYGQGADHRLTVAHEHYVGRIRRSIAVDDLGRRIVVRFEGDLLAETPEPSRWQRILASVRRWFNGPGPSAGTG